MAEDPPDLLPVVFRHLDEQKFNHRRRIGR